MENKITKAYLLGELRAARAEWDELMAEVGEARMTEAGAVGEWSVKDVIAHLTAYHRWFVLASEAHFRGELPPLDGTEAMSPQARNEAWHDRTKHLPLDEVLAESRRLYARLMEMVEKHSEEFLTQPQKYESVPEPILIWELLRYDDYDHYRDHARMVREWLDKG